MTSETKYDRRRIDSYLQTKEAMTTTRIKSVAPKTKVVPPEESKEEEELKFVKLPPSKEKLLCIYIEKFEAIVHSFITEFLESQLFRLPRDSVPNNYNLKTKIKLMNYILLKFDLSSRKLLQEEVLSTLCHLVCHQRKLLKSDSYRSCDLNKCNILDLVWALKKDHTKHLDELLRRLKSEFKEKAQSYDPESLRAQQAYVEESLVPIYNEDRPASPRVIPHIHYRNVIQQIFRKKGCTCESDHSDVYAVRKEFTEFPPPPFDRASLLIGATGKSGNKLITSFSRDQLSSTKNVNNLARSGFFGSGPGAGDCAYTYTGLFGIRSPEERKILECKVAAHLRALGQKCPFKVRPCSAATSSYRRMIVNEITTLQSFEDSLLNYSLMSNCIPLLWCGQGPDGKPLLYPTDYKSCDCSTRIGPSANNLALSHRLFKTERDGAKVRAEARKKRKGRPYASDSSTSSRRTGGRPSKRWKKKGTLAHRSYSATSVSTSNSGLGSGRPRRQRSKSTMKQPLKMNRETSRERSRGGKLEKHFVNKTTSTLQAMLALEYEKNHGKLSAEARSIQTELEYRKMMERGEMPMSLLPDSEEEGGSAAEKDKKRSPKTSVTHGKRLSGRRSRPSVRHSQYSIAGSVRSCGTLCDQSAQTHETGAGGRRSRSNLKDKGTGRGSGGGEDKFSHNHGMKEHYFSQAPSRRASRSDWAEETTTKGGRRSQDKRDSKGSSGHHKASQMAPRASVMRHGHPDQRRSHHNHHRPRPSHMDARAGPSVRASHFDVHHHPSMKFSTHDKGHGVRASHAHLKPHPRYSMRNSAVDPMRQSHADFRSGVGDRSTSKTPDTSPGRKGEHHSHGTQSHRHRTSHEGAQTGDGKRASLGTQADGKRGSWGTQTHRRSGTSLATQAHGPVRSSFGIQAGSGKSGRHSFGTQAAEHDHHHKGRQSTFGVQTNKGSISEGAQTRHHKRAEDDGDAQTDEDRINEGNQWDGSRKHKRSHDKGTLKRPGSSSKEDEDEDAYTEDSGQHKRGGGRYSNAGTDPAPLNTKDANVGDKTKGGKTTKERGVGVTPSRRLGFKTSKEGEAQVSDDDERKSNSSERRWKHATFSRSLIKGPGAGQNGAKKSVYGPRPVLHGKGNSKIKFAPRMSQGFSASEESKMKLHHRKKTGFVKGAIRAHEKLEALYEANAARGGKVGDDGDKRRSRISSVKDGRQSNQRMSLYQRASRLPKLTSDKGLNTEQARRDKFFDSLKSRGNVPPPKAKPGQKSLLVPPTGSITDVAHWRNVERIAEYSKALRPVSKLKPLPWNARPDGWDEFGQGKGPRPIGFGDDLDGMVDGNFPGGRGAGGRFRAGGTCGPAPGSEGEDRKPSKLLTTDRDEIIDLTIPQENFFWVPLGRYSWEVRNIKVWKSQFVPTREKSKEYLGIFPEIKIPAKPSNSTCFDTEAQNVPKRFASCSDICNVCLLDTSFCQCD